VDQHATNVLSLQQSRKSEISLNQESRIRTLNNFSVLLSLVTAALLVFAAGCAKKTPTLSLLVWEGYAAPLFVKAFEESHHCRITAAYMGTSDELVAKLRKAVRAITT